MEKAVLGNNGPVIKLFHYGGAVQGSEIRKYSYWTDFESLSKADVSRMTGQPEIYFLFRSMVRVNRDRIDEFFSNEATKMMPGLPPADEYKNKVPIPITYLETIPMP